MPWPGPTDYVEEIQTPKLCFRDPDLKQSQPRTTSLGIPHLITGNFAGVCEMHHQKNHWAVRCFLREVSDQQNHYQDISNYLNNHALPEFVTFQYQHQGIKVRGVWYPIVKMEWVAGKSLTTFLELHLKKPKELLSFAEQWRQLVAKMRHHGLAHGDLQHGNIMVTKDKKIKLVDYDAMYVPAALRTRCPELGHSNYQHPARAGNHYDQNLDNFSAVVIYLSLLALAQDHRLWQEFNNSENLILTKEDYRQPSRSKALTSLKKHRDERVKQLALSLEKFCQGPISQVPDLESLLGQITGGTGVPPPATAGRWWEAYLPGRSQPAATSAGAGAAPWWSSAPPSSTPTPAPTPAAPPLAIPKPRSHWLPISLLIIFPCVILGIFLLSYYSRPPQALPPVASPPKHLSPPPAKSPTVATSPLVEPAIATPKIETPLKKPVRKWVRKAKPPEEAAPESPMVRVAPPRTPPPASPPAKPEPAPAFRFGTPEVKQIK
jgi:hypothetical protein